MRTNTDDNPISLSIYDPDGRHALYTWPILVDMACDSILDVL